MGFDFKMPIVVKDYEWEETNTTMYITVPLKGVKKNKVDITSTEKYIKVSYPPYIFECFLHAEVDDDKSTAEVNNALVLFKLEKVVPVIWTQLQCDKAGDKDEQRVLRTFALERYQERLKEKKEQQDIEKRNRDKYAVNSQIKLEEQTRGSIEQIKEDERQKAMGELEAWKEHQRQLAEEEHNRAVERSLAKEKEENRIRAENEAKNTMFDEEKSEEQEQPRRVGHIDVSFTPRTFPTPQRESVAADEEEWLRKQEEVRRIAEVNDADLTEEEKNPVWLRDKAAKFFQSGDFHSAINAFTHAMRLSPAMPGLYSNRAACHLKLGNYIKCAEDSAKALELLTPPVPQNAASRIKAHIRRGTALCQLELYVEGLMDYEAALKVDPSNDQLQKDADRIRDIVQSSAGS